MSEKSLITAGIDVGSDRFGIDIRCSGDALNSALAELLEHAADLPLELRQRVLCVLDALPEIVRVDVDIASARDAGECRVVLQPSDALLELMAALRARNFEFFAVEIQGHGPFLS